MKPIRLTRHAQEQCQERGAAEEEVRIAIRHGTKETAKQGRELCRYNVSVHPPPPNPLPQGEGGYAK